MVFESESYRRHALVSGKVQNVGFRWYAREKAVDLGLTGWVRNLPDGRVELWFQGEIGAVEAMEEWCRRGSPTASVMKAEITDEPVLDYEKVFEIR